MTSLGKPPLAIGGLPGLFVETWLLASSYYGFDEVLNSVDDQLQPDGKAVVQHDQ